MARLLRREGKFFDFFNEHADLAMLAAAELKALLDDIGDLELRRRNIERYEKQADHITHQTIALLHKTFITPLDRDEIHQLITGMDDILDLIEDVAQCLFLYDVRAVPGEARRLAEICVACIAKVKEAVAKLESMNDADAILKICADIVEQRFELRGGEHRQIGMLVEEIEELSFAAQKAGHRGLYQGHREARLSHRGHPSARSNMGR